METIEKIHKKKRKNKEESEVDGSSRSDRDIEHRSKRVHLSSSGADISTDQQEKMLDTVSGHIQELAIKEKGMDGGSKTSKQTKAGSKSKKVKKRQTKSSKRDESGGKETSSANDVASHGTSAQDTEESTATESGVSQESALEYLRLWKEERESWSFKKKTQYWLLQNIYDRTKVPKSGFKIMLRYLAGLQGHQRQLSVQKAKKIIDQYGEEGSSTSRRHYKRAVAIMRVLG